MIPGSWLEAEDESCGEGLRMAGDAALRDSSAAVAVVGDAPVEVRKDRCVDSTDPAVVEVGGIFVSIVLGAVGGDSGEELDVGLEGEDGEMEGDAWAEEAAVDVAGKVAAGVDRDGDGAKVGKSVVEAEGSGSRPAGVVDLAFFCADGAVDCEFGLGVEGCGEEREQKDGEDEDVFAAHA
jgi:hypothetical protein